MQINVLIIFTDVILKFSICLFLLSGSHGAHPLTRFFPSFSSPCQWISGLITDSSLTSKQPLKKACLIRVCHTRLSSSSVFESFVIGIITHERNYMSEVLSEKGGGTMSFQWKNRNGEGRQQSASWHIYSFAYYFAAVVVCLLIKDNPIKALQNSLRGIIHANTSQSGSSLGERTGCRGVCKACIFYPSLPLQTGLQKSMPGAWGAETITCPHGGFMLALELVSCLPGCAPPRSAFLSCVGWLVPECTYAHLHCIPL